MCRDPHAPADAARPHRGSFHRAPTRRGVLRAGAAGVAGLAGVAFLNPSLSWAAPTRIGGDRNTSGTGPHVGRGVGDCTGEPLGAGMNGYAVLEQSSIGMRSRQRARAFVLGTDPARPAVALVTVEIGLMFNAILRESLRRLDERLPGVFHDGNLLVTATHTHSVPGGSSGHAMVDVTSLGFRPTTFESNVAGIVDAVVAACADYAPSRVVFTESTLTDAGANRSRGSFDRDPEEDRAHFPAGVDTRSVNMQVARGGDIVGVLNWFALHPTSLGPENRVANTDNKGYAAWVWETERGVDHRRDGATPGFVAAFAQSAPGDITPNLGLVPGSGPGGADENRSAEILGTEIHRAARAQVDASLPTETGPIEVAWRYVDMAAVTVRPEFTSDGREFRTTPAMLGAAFAASSQEDGGGLDITIFQEGARGGNPVIRAINQAVVPPEFAAAHAPKDILLPAGLVPGAIQQVFGFHLVRIGGVYLFALGFEPTIVAGLRIRRVIAERLGIDLSRVLVQGYTNGYGHYLTTPEEYRAQNYEGGATIFGREQLGAILQVAAELADSLRAGRPAREGGRRDDDETGRLPVAPTGRPWIDAVRPGQDFGHVLTEPTSSYAKGQEVVVRFVGANPNNDLRRGGTYLEVQRREGSAWTTVADDAHWHTTINFENALVFTDVEIRWRIPVQTASGTYRIAYHCDPREPGRPPRSVTGHTRDFAVN